MGRGVFKRVIQGQGAKPASADGQGATEAPEKKDAPASSIELVPTVYGDEDVCRCLRIHRKVIADARTKKTRGLDWDCVGLHAGMTMAWIQAEALRRGVVPDFTNRPRPLEPIRSGDGIASCRLLATWPNKTRVTVEVVATGEAKVATVRDANEFHLYDIFDARDYGREIQWTAELNNATY